MKTLFLAVSTLLCATAFAQAPSGTATRTPQEADANKSGGPAAAKAEMKTDAKKSTGMKSMDANGDGMVSKSEWDTYHAGMWGKMKLKNGMASMADVEAMAKGGPN